MKLLNSLCNAKCQLDLVFDVRGPSDHLIEGEWTKSLVDVERVVFAEEADFVEGPDLEFFCFGDLVFDVFDDVVGDVCVDLSEHVFPLPDFGFHEFLGAFFAEGFGGLLSALIRTPAFGGREGGAR